MTDLIFHGGVEGEIGGNAIRLIDRGYDVQLFLDFGVNFAKRARFYHDPYLVPKTVEEIVKAGLAPELPIYEGYEGRVDGVLISHAHQDHYKYISLLNREIPIYASEATIKLIQSRHVPERKTLESDIGGLNLKALKTEAKLGGIEIKSIEVAHSVPSSHALILYTSDAIICYTGDLRAHGRRSQLTESFAEELERDQVDCLITEATNLTGATLVLEKEVERKIESIVSKTDGLVLMDISDTDMERMETALLAAERSGRFLVLTKRLAWNALALSGCEGVPDVMRLPVLVYRDRDPRYRWEEELENRLSDKMIPSEGIHRSPNDFILCTSIHDPRELVEIEPRKGVYISSLSEPFAEERSYAFSRLVNWLDLYGIPLYSIRSSGHIDPLSLKEFVKRAKPKRVYPVHTQRPSLFRLFMKGIAEVTVPKRGVAYRI